MDDSQKTREQLVIECAELRQKLGNQEGKEPYCSADPGTDTSDKSSFLENIFESIIHPLYVIDIDDHTVRMTNSAARKSGLLENHACHATTHHHGAACGSTELLCPIEEVKKAGLPVTVEHRHIDCDGNLHIMEIHGYPVFDRTGRLIQLITYALDITDRKLTEEALRVSYRFLEIANRHTQMEPLLREFVQELRAYSDCSTVAIRILDEKGRIPFTASEGLSPCFEQESYHKLEKGRCLCAQVIRGDHETLDPHFTAGGSFFTNSSSASFAQASGGEIEKIRCVSHELNYESLAIVPIRIEKRTIGLIHIADPDTMKVSLEKIEALEKVAMELGAAIQRLQAEEALKLAREEYLSTLTHDMKNPLTSILSSLRLIGDPRFGEISEQKRGFVDMTRNSCEILLTMINNIINVSRLEAGETRCTFTEVRLLDLLQEVREIFLPLAMLATISLRIDCPDSIRVSIDREKMREVFNNLVGNAIRYTPKGGEISLSAEVRDGCVRISVSDNGQGIPEEYHETIFQKFSQVKGERIGTGLGLYIVKNFLHLHGSEITIRSAPGQGTRFSFSLAETEHPEEVAKARPAILLMCVDASLASIIREALSREGFEVDLVSYGPEALNIKRAKKPDLMIACDAQCTLDAGTCNEIITGAARQDIPIILITTYHQSEHLHEVAALIPLPLDTELLKEAIYRLLSGKQGK
jgi:PAS domain S-box-containing protein